MIKILIGARPAPGALPRTLFQRHCLVVSLLTATVPNPHLSVFSHIYMFLLPSLQMRLFAWKAFLFPPRRVTLFSDSRSDFLLSWAPCICFHYIMSFLSWNTYRTCNFMFILMIDLSVKA